MFSSARSRRRCRRCNVLLFSGRAAGNRCRRRRVGLGQERAASRAGDRGYVRLCGKARPECPRGGVSAQYLAMVFKVLRSSACQPARRIGLLYRQAARAHGVCCVGVQVSAIERRTRVCVGVVPAAARALAVYPARALGGGCASARTAGDGVDQRPRMLIADGHDGAPRDDSGADPRTALADGGGSCGCGATALGFVAGIARLLLAMYAGRTARRGPTDRCSPPRYL